MTFFYQILLKCWKVFWKILRNNRTKSEASCQLKSSLKNCFEHFWEIPRKSFVIERILKAHKYVEHELTCWSFSWNFLKICRTAILKENFIKERFWMSTSDEAILNKKDLVEGNPPQSWPWKQNRTTVVDAVMILEDTNNWRRTLQNDILKNRKVRLWTQITFLYRKCLLPVCDWCLHGIYVWQKLQKENILNWVIIRIKLKEVH